MVLLYPLVHLWWGHGTVVSSGTSVVGHGTVVSSGTPVVGTWYCCVLWYTCGGDMVLLLK